MTLLLLLLNVFDDAPVCRHVKDESWARHDSITAQLYRCLSHSSVDIAPSASNDDAADTCVVKRRHNVVVWQNSSALISINDSTSVPVSTGMGDHSRVRVAFPSSSYLIRVLAIVTTTAGEETTSSV